VLSVVIPCRNAATTLGEQLEALSGERWDKPWEVIVSDNGSTDGSLAVVRRFESALPGLRVVDSADVRGPAHAMNVGAKAALGSRLAFCDADDVVGAGWVKAVGEALEKYPFVAAVQETARLNPSWVLEAREPLGARLPMTRFAPHLPYAGAGTIGVRKAVHDRVGGFDVSIGALFEIDYALRLRAAGVPLVLVPEAIVHYRWRNSIQGIFRQAVWYADGAAAVQKRHAANPTSVRALTRWPLVHWKAILAQLPRLTSRGGRARMAWLLGWQAGRIRATVKHRVLVF